MNDKSIKAVLLVEDNPGDARLLREMFKEQGSRDTELAHVDSMQAAETYLAERAVDIILLDLGLPDAQGLEAVRRTHAAAPHTPLVVLTGLDDESLAIRTLQEGAQDYLVKGQIETRGLPRTLRYAIERKVLEEALFGEKERAEVTLNSIGDAVACTDNEGRITFLNLVGEKMTGWTMQEAEGRPMAEVIQILEDTRHEAVSNRLQIGLTLEKGARQPSNSILVRRDGFEIPVEDSVAPIHDREGKTTGVVIVLRDVSAARAMALQITHLAEHDFLTGLPNRLLLSDRVGQALALAGRHTHKVAVLFLDLDGFKHINDSLGHSIGDKLLQSTAKRLVGCVSDLDTVSRQGGDEFVVLLFDVEKWEDAAVTANRILSALADVHMIDQYQLHITASIGIGISPDDGHDAETLIKNADTAMYQAKANGRHSYQFFKPAMYARALERQSIEEGLRRALELHELALHYQPVVNLATGEIVGAEALLRWMDPARGVVSPADFIPVAEDSGLIVPIGTWVLREACRQAIEWADVGLPIGTIAVNVSALEFRSETFLDGVVAILDETGIAPRSLVIELTESVLMKRAEVAESILRALREKSVQIAIDDFGTGYSSLSYLRRFPVDALKIDQSFIRQISSAPEDTGIVTAVISMARSLGLRVIAEGVETTEELAFLRSQLCDEVQGYYFSRPVAAPQFAELLRAGIPQAAPVMVPEMAGKGRVHRVASPA